MGITGIRWLALAQQVLIGLTMGIVLMPPQPSCAAEPDLAKLVRETPIFTNPLMLIFPPDQGLILKQRLTERPCADPNNTGVCRKAFTDAMGQQTAFFRKLGGSMAGRVLYDAGFYKTEAAEVTIARNCSVVGFGAPACQPQHHTRERIEVQAYAPKLYSCLSVSQPHLSLAYSWQPSGPVAFRKMGRTTYRNEYKGTVNGVETKLISIVFNYEFDPRRGCEGIERLWREYSGKLTAYMDPTDGTWKVRTFDLDVKEPDYR